MQLLKLLLSLTIFTSAWASAAPQCTSLFNKTAPKADLEIQVLKKKETMSYFTKIKEQSIEKKTYKEIESLLKKMSKNGSSSLREADIELITDFRQDISFLRSSYEILSQKHKSPKKFNEFVKLFGKLKDLALMKENLKSKEIAQEILDSVSFKKLDSMLKESDLANAQSVRLYLEDRIGYIRYYITLKSPTVEELHTTRKAIRNIYRYLEIQKKSVHKTADQSEILKRNLNYLKKLNKELGLICDHHASLILSEELNKSAVYRLPQSLQERLKDLAHKITIIDEEISL